MSQEYIIEMEEPAHELKFKREIMNVYDQLTILQMQPVAEIIDKVLELIPGPTEKYPIADAELPMVHKRVRPFCIGHICGFDVERASQIQ